MNKNANKRQKSTRNDQKIAQNDPKNPKKSLKTNKTTLFPAISKLFVHCLGERHQKPERLVLFRKIQPGLARIPFSSTEKLWRGQRSLSKNLQERPSSHSGHWGRQRRFGWLDFWVWFSENHCRCAKLARMDHRPRYSAYTVVSRATRQAPL